MSHCGRSTRWSSLQSVRTPVLTGVLGAVLAVTTMIGIQRAQLAPHRHVRNVASPQQTVASIGKGGGAGAMGKASTAAGVSRPHAVPHVFLPRTASEEQAFRAWLARGGLGTPEGADEPPGVILASSVEEAGFANAALLEQVK